MGVVIVFGLVAILALISTFRAFKTKNILGILFAGGGTLVFGWFTIMTIIHSGYPALV